MDYLEITFWSASVVSMFDMGLKFHKNGTLNDRDLAFTATVAFAMGYMISRKL